MLVIDPAQAKLVAGIVMLDGQRAILLRQSGKRAGQPDVVLAVGRRNGDGGVACRLGQFDIGRDGSARQPLAGLDLVGLGDRDDFARSGLGDLGGLVALDGEQSAEPGRAAVGGLELAAFGDRPAEHPRQRQSTDRPAMVDFEGVKRRIGDRQAPGGGIGPGRFVAQGFQQTADAPAAAGRAEQYRHAEILSGFAGEVGKDGRLLGHLVHQQLLEQSVVMVGQPLKHLGARFGFALGEIGRDVDPL